MTYANKRLATALVALLAFGAGQAKADLVYQGPITLGGTGLGAVPTILTMNGKGQSTSESELVGWTGSKDVVTTDPTTGPTGNPTNFVSSTQSTGINNTILVSDTGWKAGIGDGLGIVFNPSEPQSGAKSSITLNNLEMTIYGATTGKVLFDAPWLDGPLTLDAVDAGTGKSGYLFALNQTETNELNAAGVAGGDHIGLMAYATNAQGGNETFFGTVIACTGDSCNDPPTVPEPASLALFGVGLLGLGFVTAKRRN